MALRVHCKVHSSRESINGKIRAPDAMEVGVGNPAEETYCYPNKVMLQFSNDLSTFIAVKCPLFSRCFANSSKIRAGFYTARELKGKEGARLHPRASGTAKKTHFSHINQAQGNGEMGLPKRGCPDCRAFSFVPDGTLLVAIPPPNR